MTAFDFDQITDRRGTMSLKYDFARARGVREDALPLWVADMDFPTAPCVTEALHRAVDHGIFGYTDVDAGDPENDYVWAIRSWYRERFHYEVQPDWLVCTPGVGFGPSGEGYVRFTAFGSHEQTEEALRRIKAWSRG